MSRLPISFHLTDTDLGALVSNEASVLDPEELDAAIVGVVESLLVYDYDRLVEVFAHSFSNELELGAEDYERAVEWVDFNTLRALPYMPKAPLIVQREAELDPDDPHFLLVDGVPYYRVA